MELRLLQPFRDGCKLWDSSSVLPFRCLALGGIYPYHHRGEMQREEGYFQS